MYQDNYFNELIIDNFAGGGGMMKMIKEALWRIVGKESVVITNQNIDKLLDRAFSEAFLPIGQEVVFKLAAGDIHGHIVEIKMRASGLCYVAETIAKGRVVFSPKQIGEVVQIGD